MPGKRCTAAVEYPYAKVSPVLIQLLTRLTRARLQVVAPACQEKPQTHVRRTRFKIEEQISTLILKYNKADSDPCCPTWKNTLQASFEWLFPLTRLLPNRHQTWIVAQEVQYTIKRLSKVLPQNQRMLPCLHFLRACVCFRSKHGQIRL